MRLLIPLASAILFFITWGATEAARAVDTFVYCVEGVATQLDPNQATDVMTENTFGQTVFNKLVDVDPATGAIIPSLALSWKVTPDGRAYTFQLRKDVSFHSRSDFSPTRTFNADDVLKTFERMKTSKLGSFGIFNSFGYAKSIAKIEKLGSHEVKFYLNGANSNFIVGLSHPGLSIQSAEFLEAHSKNKSLLPIGTGPFVLQKFQTDELARFSAHPAYWGGKPKISNLVIRFVPDGNVRVQSLKTGACDFISEVPPAERAGIEASDQLVLHERPGFNVGYLGFNTERPHLKDPQVRKAISSALDVSSYISAIYLNRAVVATLPIQKGTMGFVEAPSTKYDFQKAQKEIRALGDRVPKKLDFLVLPISRAYNPSGKKMAEMMQANLAKVGITLNLIETDWATFLDRADRGSFDLLLLGGNMHSRDPGIFLNAFFSCEGIGGMNSVRFCHPEFEKHLKAAKEAGDEKQKEIALQAAMKVFARELPALSIAHGKVARASRKGLTDYTLGAAGREDFSKTDLVKR